MTNLDTLRAAEADALRIVERRALRDMRMNRGEAALISTIAGEIAAYAATVEARVHGELDDPHEHSHGIDVPAERWQDWKMRCRCGDEMRAEESYARAQVSGDWSAMFPTRST